VAIALPGRDRLPPGPTRDFAEALHKLYDLAGQPASRQVSRAIFKSAELEAVSHETVSSMLRGRIPAWGKVQSVVTVLARLSIREQNLDSLVSDFHDRWLQARRPGLRAPVPQQSDVRDHAPESISPRGPVSPAAPTLAAPADERPPREPMAVLVEERIIGGGLPERNPFFTGRDGLLESMRARHRENSSAPLVLHGIGGVGKTQLAREYVHRYTDDYSMIWWVPADRVEQARASLVSLAERLGLTLRQRTEQTIVNVLSRLESQQVNYLLIFDGTEGDDVRDLIPAIGGNVIVTSRDPAWAFDSANVRLEVPDFDRGEAVQFLRRRDPAMTGEQARTLTERIGGLPLALEQLASLRLASGGTWQDLLARLDQPDPPLPTTAGLAQHDHTVAASLTLTLDQLHRANPVAAMVFELFAWFGSEPVSLALLQEGAAADVRPRELKRALGNPIQLHRIAAEFGKYGLGRLHREDQRIEVQPLMRLALRGTLADEPRERAQHNVHEILVGADHGRPDELALWDMHQAIAPHVLPSRLIDARRPEMLGTVVNQIRFRYVIGEYEDARRLGEAAVTAWSADPYLGPGHEVVLRASREWANALRGLGRYREARELTDHAMTLLRADPKAHADRSYALDMALSHAADLRLAGEYENALALDEATYEAHVQRFAADSDRSVASRHNLAVDLRLLGRFTAAVPIDRAEVDFNREHRGEGDRRTVLSVTALAEDLYGLGSYRAVLEEQLPALAVAERSLRHGDRGILLARRTVALARRRLGELPEAAELIRGTYDDAVLSFGADHEFTLAVTMSYANALRAGGREREAYTYAVRAVNAYEHAFGQANPLTLAAQVNLAAILRARGDRFQARRADEAALRTLRQSVGDRHPCTVVAMINLATDLALAGDDGGALELSEEAWDTARTVRGPRHPDTLMAAANLLIDRERNGVVNSAGPSTDELLGTLRRVLGPAHPAIADAAGGIRMECDIEPPAAW
jgi:tetratricopeptide (TPR) repeat protein